MDRGQKPGCWAGLILAVILMSAMMNLFMPPVEKDDLAKLNPAMTKEDVEELLGKPSSVAGYIWTYESKARFAKVRIVFDADGHYRSHKCMKK